MSRRALLGVLYHGCDDVGDVKGLESLGGGGEEDLRDGILTLPASIAIKDPIIAELFCKSERLENELGGSAGRGGALGPTGGRGEVGGAPKLRESRTSVCSCGSYQGAIAPLAVKSRVDGLLSSPKAMWLRESRASENRRQSWNR